MSQQRAFGTLFVAICAAIGAGIGSGLEVWLTQSAFMGEVLDWHIGILDVWNMIFSVSGALLGGMPLAVWVQRRYPS